MGRVATLHRWGPTPPNSIRLQMFYFNHPPVVMGGRPMSTPKDQVCLFPSKTRHQKIWAVLHKKGEAGFS